MSARTTQGSLSECGHRSVEVIDTRILVGVVGDPHVPHRPRIVDGDERSLWDPGVVLPLVVVEAVPLRDPAGGIAQEGKGEPVFLDEPFGRSRSLAKSPARRRYR